jgi:hypothetical protein
MNSTVRGTLIGDSVFVSSNTAAQARVQYNGNYFPTQPASTLVCAVTLQGRPPAPSPAWSVPLTVSLTVAGNDTPTYQFTPISDENGIFTVPDITPGSYELRLKHSHTLQNMLLVDLQAGSNNYDCSTLLEGDANNDNFVTLTDFSILSTTFGKCEGTMGYDERADFNEDDCIAILDFSLLAVNFGQGGDMAPVRKPSIQLQVK